MSRIVVLDQFTANQIAAGEVVERPASAVKELVENSLDAGATEITVEITAGGLSEITVRDNGWGMDEEDARLALLRHATSKIRGAEDLFRITTLGFRGEALPSIAAVSKLTLKTRPAGSDRGTHLEVEGGQVLSCRPAALAPGTIVQVRDLFYNTPARKKYLKSAGTEGGAVGDALSRLALARPEASIRFIHNRREIFATPGTGKLLEALAAVMGMETARQMLPVEDISRDWLAIRGYAGRPVLHRSNRRQIIVLVNGRYVYSSLVALAVQEAYHTLLPAGRHPVAVISLQVDPELLDVNVHPAKLQVRLAREREVAGAVTRAVREALISTSLVIPGMPAGEAYAGRPPGLPSSGHRGDTRRAVQPGQGEGATIPPLFPAALPPAGSVEDFLPPESPVSPGQCRERDRYVKKDMAAAPEIDWPPAGQPCGDGLLAEDLPGYSCPVCRDGREGETAHDAPVSGESVSTFPPLHYLGQLPPTYLLAAGPGGLYMVDQHAAHERILYEKYLSGMAAGGLSSQMLLLPVNVFLSHREATLLAEKREFLTSLGFVLDFFSGDTVVVRGVPLDFPPGEEESYLRDILAYLGEPGRSPSREDLLHHLAARTACRAAVKAGALLSEAAALALLEQLAQAQNPYTCPHGRPAVILLSYQELAQRFKR